MVKYKIIYEVRGVIEIELDEAKTYQEIESAFNDKTGFSEDDLYENLNHDFKVKSIIYIPEK